VLLDLKHLGLLLKLKLRSTGLISELGDLLLLLVENLLLLLDLLSEGDSLIVQPVLLPLLVNLGIPGHLDLLSQVIDGLDEVNDLLLTGLPTVHKVLVLLTGALHSFLLLLANLAQVFKLLLQVLEDLFFRELYILKRLEFECSDLIAQLLDLLSLLLLLISLVLHLFIGLGDLGLKGRDALNFRGRHADGCTHR
jgi:hypothetical protein